MKFTLFLGAGASTELGFPSTETFKNNLENTLDEKQDARTLNILQKSDHKDIEEVLTAIESLLDLPNNKGHNLLQKITDCTYKEGSDIKSFDSIKTEISACKIKIEQQIYDEYSWNNTPNDKLMTTYDGMFNILDRSDDGIHICTTNYDQVMEHYINMDNNGLIMVDGFAHDNNTQKVFFNSDNFNNKHNNVDQSTKNSYLYKIHGSLNWIDHGENKIQRRDENESWEGTNLVLYPTLSCKKDYYKKEPYTTLQDQFKNRIQETDVFIVVGCSLRDREINDQFENFLKREKTRMFVISPDADKKTTVLLNKSTPVHSLNFQNPEHLNLLGKWKDLYQERNTPTS